MKGRRSITSTIGAVIVLIVAYLIYHYLGTPSTTAGPIAPSKTSTTQTSNEPNWGHPTKTSGCVATLPLQDKDCTPGAIFPDATKEKICVPGYAKSVRDVSTSLKKRVYTAYGIKSHLPGQYEVDHLVSLQLGGSNDIANLWPEPAAPKPGFHEKDAVENYLHAQICSGAMTVKQAQIAIATNWIDVYNHMKNQQPANDSDGDGE